MSEPAPVSNPPRRVSTGELPKDERSLSSAPLKGISEETTKGTSDGVLAVAPAGKKTAPANGAAPSDRHSFPSNSAAKTTDSAPVTTKPVSQNSPAKDQIKGNLYELSITYDPSNLPKIEPFLYSEDSEIREAAIDAIVLLKRCLFRWG